MKRIIITALLLITSCSEPPNEIVQAQCLEFPFEEQQAVLDGFKDLRSEGVDRDEVFFNVTTFGQADPAENTGCLNALLDQVYETE